MFLRAQRAGSRMWRERIVEPSRDLSFAEVVVAVVAGLIGGIFPIPLATTVVTLVFARSLSLILAQIVLAMSINMCCTPLQVMLIPVFARAAASWVGEDASNYTAASLAASLEKGLLALLRSSTRMLICASLAWVILLLPVWVGCYAVQRKARHARSAAAAHVIIAHDEKD